VWNTVQAGTVAVGGGEACEGLFSRGLEVNEMGCKLIISHGVVEKVKNGFNETRAQCTSTFFLTLAREDTAILIIERLLCSERRQSFSY
jgi:hypothetical protein